MQLQIPWDRNNVFKTEMAHLKMHLPFNIFVENLVVFEIVSLYFTDMGGFLPSRYSFST